MSRTKQPPKTPPKIAKHWKIFDWAALIAAFGGCVVHDRFPDRISEWMLCAVLLLATALSGAAVWLHSRLPKDAQAKVEFLRLRRHPMHLLLLLAVIDIFVICGFAAKRI